MLNFTVPLGNEVRQITDNWIHEYNEERPHASLSYLSSNRYLKNYYTENSLLVVTLIGTRHLHLACCVNTGIKLITADKNLAKSADVLNFSEELIKYLQIILILTRIIFYLDWL